MSHAKPVPRTIIALDYHETLQWAAEILDCDYHTDLHHHLIDEISGFANDTYGVWWVPKPGYKETSWYRPLPGRLEDFANLMREHFPEHDSITFWISW